MAQQAQQPTTAQTNDHASERTEIDLPRLARKVYEQLKQEIRLERERRGRHWQL